MVKSVTTISVDSQVLMKLRAQGKNVSSLCNSFLSTMATDSSENNDPMLELEKQKLVVEELKDKLNIAETKLYAIKAECNAKQLAEEEANREEAIMKAKAYRMHKDHSNV